MPHLTPDDRLIDKTPPFTSGARVGWWGGYTLLVLMAFCFGVWTGNQKPRPVEQATAAAPVEKAEVAPEPKKELTPEPKKTPESKVPEPKVPESKKTPEVVTPPMKTPELAMPEPKKTPEVLTPEPKKTPEPKAPPMVKEVLFAKEVLPIFKAKCTICHGDSKGIKGELDLRTLAKIVKGGDNGPGVKGGDLKTGTVWQSIDDGSMPPAGKEQLTDAEKAVIRDWILSGAK